MSKRNGYPAQPDWNERVRRLGDVRRRVAVIRQVLSPGYRPVPLGDGLREAQVQIPEQVELICKENVSIFPEERRESLCFILAYTFDFGGVEMTKNPYYIINQALLQGSFEDIMRVRHLLFGLFSALRTLPYYKYPVLYRGLKGFDRWNKDDLRHWPCFTSTSLEKSVALSFLSITESGHHSGTILIIKGAFGYDVSVCSQIPDEKEVIIEPGQNVYVENTSKTGEILNVELKPIERETLILQDRIPQKPKPLPGQKPPPPQEPSDEELISEAEGFFNGKKQARNPEKAISLVRRAKKVNNSNIIVVVGNCYFNGDGVKQDKPEAVSWFRRASDMGNPEGASKLAHCYQYGIGVGKDLGQAVRLYEFSFSRGHQEFRDDYGEALADLGYCYQEGIGVGKNLNEAVRLYNLSVGFGNAKGENRLGRCYLNGWGVAKDLCRATPLFRSAAEKGNADAQNNYGWFFMGGRGGLPVNYQEALKWLKMSAEKGHSDAEFNLGHMYEHGMGVPQSRGDALYWYRRSADHGDQDARVKVRQLGG